jgi:hypothetical protein
VTDTKLHTARTAIMPALNTQQPTTRWRKVTLTELHEVEKLLDRLESERRDSRLTVDGDTFVIRWRE